MVVAFVCVVILMVVGWTLYIGTSSRYADKIDRLEQQSHLLTDALDAQAEVLRKQGIQADFLDCSFQEVGKYLSLISSLLFALPEEREQFVPLARRAGERLDSLTASDVCGATLGGR